MRSLDELERSIMELTVAPTTKVDKRILDDALTALGESVRMQGVLEPSARRRVLLSRIAKVAVAAVIIAAAVAAIEVFRGPSRPTEPRPTVWFSTKTELIAQEQERIVDMFAGGDAGGLAAMLSEGQFESKVLAALCLGEIGDERALAGLQRLYLLAEEKLPEGYTENPFAEPLEKLRNRIEEQQAKPGPAADANAPGQSDANDTAQDNANIAAMPAETEVVLSLLVVHKETGEPLADIEVAVWIQREGPDENFKKVTDEEGRCSIAIGDRKTKHIRIDVSKEKFVPVQIDFSRKGDSIEIPQSYTLALEPGTAIGGFIQNEQGEPIEGATVFLLVPQRRQDAVERVSLRDHEEKTNADGFWRCEHMPARLEEVWVRLAHPDYVDDEVYGTTVKLTVDELRSMSSVVVMKKGVTISGSVVDQQWRPVEGARVAQGSSRWGTNYASTTTDAAGRFEFAQARAGKMVLTVQAEGFSPDLKEVSVDKDSPPVEFRLEPGRTIRGQILDSQDRPIEGAFVAADTWRGHRSVNWRVDTDSQGLFEWDEAPADEVLFDMGKEGYMSVRKFGMSPSVDEYVIVMYRPLRVSGSVVDADSNEPIGEFRLLSGFVWEEGRSPYWDERSVKRFRGGEYEVEFNEPREGYAIRIEADGYLPGVSEVFTDDQGEVVYDFALVKGEGPSGVVRLADGGPAAGVEVVLCTVSQGIQIRNGTISQKRNRQIVTTGADGWFSFAAQTESYSLAAIGEAGYANIAEKELEASGEISLQPWGRVEGRLLIGSQPGANEKIAFNYNTPHEQNAPKVYYSDETVTDAKGYFVFEKAPAGRASVARQIQLRGGSTNSHTVPVEVRAGETVSVTIGGTGRAVIGQAAMPADYDEPVDWTNVYSSITTSWPQPPYPDNFHVMPRTEQVKWILNWQKTEQGMAMLEKHLVPRYPESAADMNDQEIQAWFENWKKSEEGEAFSAAHRRQQQEFRHYAAKTEQDGTFRVEDVPAGRYSLHVTVQERREGRQTHGRQELIGSLNYQFEVPDMNEGKSNEPVDLGRLEIHIQKRLKVGEMAPAFEAETLDGKTIKLADFRGKVVLLNIWISQASECIREMRHLKEAFDIFGGDEQFVIVGLSLDNKVEDAREFVKANKLRWPNCYLTHNSRQVFYKEYGATGLPCTFVVGPDGRILAKNPTSSQLEQIVAEALGIE